MNKPTTSCVILNYNDSETTISLINQIKNYRELDYIVVVDNCSTDNSFQKLKLFENKKIHIIKTNKNGGYGYGNNFGINYSYEKLNAKYITIANPDVYFSNECINKLREIFQIRDDVAITTAVPIMPNGKRQKIIAWKIPNVWQEIFTTSILYNKIAGSKKFYPDSYFENKSTVDVEVVQGSLLMVDSEKMIKYGMYDEDFFLYGEEQILAKKMIKANLKSVLLLNESYIHYHSKTISKTYRSNYAKRKLLFESKRKYLKKYHKVSSLHLMFVSCLFFLIYLEIPVINLFNLFNHKPKN